MTEQSFPSNFEVTANLGRIRVGWSDEKADYWFNAKAKGDEIVAIEPSSLRKSPTILRREHNTPGRGSARGLSYLSATDEEHADLLAAIKARVAGDKLVTKALEAAKIERAQKEAERLHRKAKAVKAALAKHGLALTIVTDEVLAEVYDDIQNSAF